MRECEYCGRSIVSKNAQARFCSDKHRNYWRRARLRAPFPAEMMARDRWIRWAPRRRKGVITKVPLTVAGRAASSTDPGTWSSFAAAQRSSAGAGLGYVLGDGIGCRDLDHCLVDGVPTAATAAFLAGFSGHYIEVSPGGDGLHIWGRLAAQPGTKRTVDGISVETYSTGRYLTVTGNVFQPGELLPL
jgi:primase-polymerase (primpol)-like protein